MSEHIDLYDINRQLTGEVSERRHCPADRYRLFVHVCIFDENGRMLIQKRASTLSIRPSLWDFSAGGAVSAGETSQIAAEREVREEVGLKLDISDHRPVMTMNFIVGFDDFYTIEVDSECLEFALQEGEVEAVKWADADEICAMIDEGTFIPIGKEFIRYIFVAREGKGAWKM